MNADITTPNDNVVQNVPLLFEVTVVQFSWLVCVVMATLLPL